MRTKYFTHIDEILLLGFVYTKRYTTIKYKGMTGCVNAAFTPV